MAVPLTVRTGSTKVPKIDLSSLFGGTLRGAIMLLRWWVISELTAGCDRFGRQ